MQGGIRKGKQFIDIVLLKQLIYEICRLTKTNMASFDNDAKVCFDRIVMPYALHKCQQLGMPTEPCKMLEKYLDNVKYHIKTKLGVSDDAFTSTDDKPLHGPGQASAAGPSVWTYVSTAAMEILAEKNNGLIFYNPTKDIKTTLLIHGFADDTTAYANKFLCELIQQTRDRYDEHTAYELLQDLLKGTEKLAQHHWEELLWST